MAEGRKEKYHDPLTLTRPVTILFYFYSLILPLEAQTWPFGQLVTSFSANRQCTWRPGCFSLLLRDLRVSSASERRPAG